MPALSVTKGVSGARACHRDAERRCGSKARGVCTAPHRRWAGTSEAVFANETEHAAYVPERGAREESPSGEFGELVLDDGRGEMMDPPSLGLNSPAEVDVFAVQAIAVIQAPERSEGLAAHSQGGTEHPIDSLRLGHHLIEHQMMPLDLGVSEEQSE